jgi:hypothetical protein
VIPKRLEEITIIDLNALISEGRAEDRTIEYKLTLPSSAESEKVPRLLKPVCSFANTDGGDLIFGVREKRGVPEALEGVVVDNIDKKKLSIEHMMQNGIETQIRGVHIRDIELDNGDYILVVRVPKSWIAPHRVKGNAKFYARNSAGTYELDIPQIRQAFLLSDILSKRLGEFRADRIANIVGDGAPVRLQEGLRIILHLVPIAAFASFQQLAVQDYCDLYKSLFPAAGGNFAGYHLNFDGLVVYSGKEQNVSLAYTQLFRSGILEFVCVYEAKRGERYIMSDRYEDELLKNYNAGISVLRKMGIDPPLIVFLTLANAKGYSLRLGNRESLFQDDPVPFDRDVMLIPDIQVESFDQRDIDVLRPMFDIVWNAGGYERSLNFDENNNPKEQLSY